jgi:probable addiction module antidote protein
MSKRTSSFKNFLADELKDPKFAAAYLNEHYGYRGPDRKDHLLEAIKNVVEAQGFSKLARESGIPRRTLYKAFSKEGNPTVETLLTLFDAIGVSIRFDIEKAKKKPVRKRAA